MAESLLHNLTSLGIKHMKHLYHAIKEEKLVPLSKGKDVWSDVTLLIVNFLGRPCLRIPVTRFAGFRIMDNLTRSETCFGVSITALKSNTSLPVAVVYVSLSEGLFILLPYFSLSQNSLPFPGTT